MIGRLTFQNSLAIMGASFTVTRRLACKINLFLVGCAVYCYNLAIKNLSNEKKHIFQIMKKNMKNHKYDLSAASILKFNLLYTARFVHK